MLFLVVAACALSCTNQVVVDVPVTGTCTNGCTDYSASWVTECPAGKRCLKVVNACANAMTLTYNVGCDGDGTPGAPQCACTGGPTLQPAGSVYWVIVNGDYSPGTCSPWTPACLTEGLSITTTPDCSGTRAELTAGNAGDLYGKFDNYDVDVENGYSGVPVTFGPALSCANDHASGDCRTLWCDSPTCPDAYDTPTTGGCPGLSPAAGCQDSFANSVGYVLTLCASSGTSCASVPPCSTR